MLHSKRAPDRAEERSALSQRYPEECSCELESTARGKALLLSSPNSTGNERFDRETLRAYRTVPLIGLKGTSVDIEIAAHHAWRHFHDHECRTASSHARRGLGTG